MDVCDENEEGKCTFDIRFLVYESMGHLLGALKDEYAVVSSGSIPSLLPSSESIRGQDPVDTYLTLLSFESLLDDYSTLDK